MLKLLIKLRNRKGFTLIELIVVIAILGILAAIIIPQFTGFQDKAKSTQALVDAKQVATAFDAWLIENDMPAAIVNDDATEDAVADLSKVDVSLFTLTVTGGVTVTENGHSAGRTLSTDPVALIS